MGDFSLLSLNTFGIPFFLSLGRLKRLAKELDQLPVETICLQEVQQNEYAPLIKNGLATFPNHCYQKHTYAPEGGLAVFSRIPVVHSNFEVYQDRGRMFSIGFADWALYKGILSVTFDVEGMPVIVMNTHMNANYSGVWHPANPLVQVELSQVRQLGRAIGSLPETSLVIVCGDFNFPRASFLYEELVKENNLLDPLVEDLRPTYRPFPLVPVKWKVPLDFVLIRQPAGKKIRVEAEIIEMEDKAKKHPVQRFLSDHNALMVSVNWE